jgi:hypothetical protein
MPPLFHMNNMDYSKEIADALSAQDFPAAAQWIAQAFEDSSSNEDLLAWCAGIAYEYKIPNTAQFIPLFVEKFPSSLHLMRIFFAKMLVDQGNFDGGANEARIHLRRLFDSGLIQSQPESPFVSQALGHGFLLLTSVYTELGARSYSQRVLNYPKALLTEMWQDAYNNEIETLKNELQDPKNQELDQKWEAFFQTGNENLQELVALCHQKNCEAIAIRLGLLEGKLRYDPSGSFKIDDQEILMTIVSDKGVYGLI